MENNETGFALGLFGGTHNKEEHEEAVREYERRKANADKIEAALMTACVVIAGRLEKDAANMNETQLSHAIGSLAGIATTISALNLYAVKPISYDFGCGCGCK